MNGFKLILKEYRHEIGEPIFLKDLTLDVKTQLSYLIGMSGSGKTTLLRLLLGLHHGCFKGEIRYYYNNKETDLRKMFQYGKVAYMSYHNTLIPWVTVKENLSLPNKLNKNLPKVSSIQMTNALKGVGISINALKKFPSQLSFGMQMRITLVRQFLYNPSFIFLDEFFTGVDEVNKNLMKIYLDNYLIQNDAVCFAITHSIDNVLDSKVNLYGITNRSKELVKFEKNNSKNEILQTLQK